VRGASGPQNGPLKFVAHSDPHHRSITARASAGRRLRAPSKASCLEEIKPRMDGPPGCLAQAGKSVENPWPGPE
jgi:hypothetical protein